MSKGDKSYENYSRVRECSLPSESMGLVLLL